MRRLSLLFAALAACGGESIFVPVTLTLDSSTCSTDAPQMVALSCDSSVGVWVKRGDPMDPDTAEQACVDFASTDQTIAALPPILSSVDLSGLGAGELWLEVAVFSPSTAEQGCPQIAEFADQMSVYGKSVATDVAAASRGLSVDLLCYAVDDGTPYDVCVADCNEVHTYCPDAAESGTCDLDYDDCLNACPVDDEPCLALCDEAYDQCLAMEPTPCGDALCDCLDACAGQLTCEDECYLTYDSCVVTNCDTTHTTCLGSCSAGQDSCAAVTSS